MPPPLGQGLFTKHDAKKWCADLAAVGSGAECPDLRVGWLRTRVFLDTKDAVEAELMEPSPCLTAEPATKTRRVTAELAADVLPWLVDIPAARVPWVPPRVSVVSEDMLEAAGRLVAEGNQVAVLNMADATKPGGGVARGAGAQEEDLHRRTDLYRFLKAQHEQDKSRAAHHCGPWTSQRDLLYPIPEDGCLLSTRVTVVRGSEKNGYPFLDKPYKISVISCAAPRGPQLTDDRQYRQPRGRERMKTKVEVILKTAVMANCPAVVLGAFGCGACGNPPELVAEFFRDALTSPESAALSEVFFCIVDDHTTNAKHNPHGNFAPFMEVLGSSASSASPRRWPVSLGTQSESTRGCLLAHHRSCPRACREHARRLDGRLDHLSTDAVDGGRGWQQWQAPSRGWWRARRDIRGAPGQRRGGIKHHRRCGFNAWPGGGGASPMSWRSAR